MRTRFFFLLLEEDGGLKTNELKTRVFLNKDVGDVNIEVPPFPPYVQALLSMQAQYGQEASAEDVMESGDCCAICQEKYSQPIKLRCKHVFCEECVSEWFERERTCPLCRAVRGALVHEVARRLSTQSTHGL